jgi:xylan 1,4-beta-xylosidase
MIRFAGIFLRSFLAITLLLSFRSAPSLAQASGQGGRDVIRISVDASKPGAPLRHVWPFFGFDECNFAVAPDARELIRTLSDSQPDPVYIRCHFLLNTGNGVPGLKWGSTNAYTEDASGNPIFDWTIMDGILGSISQSGARPLVEIGFMPKALSVRPEPYQHVYPPDSWAGWAYPPKDYRKWAALVREWARHSAARFKAAESDWLWELWNEPDIFYWQGTFEEYCRLFDFTENALHEVMPRAVLGGPHTTSPSYNRPAAFLRDFLKHCQSGTNLATGKRGTRLDYVGFHSKGATQFVGGHPRMNLAANLANNKAGFNIVAEFPEYKNTPVIIGECDPEGLAALSSTIQPANGYRNGSAYAAYEAALMKHTLELADRAGVNLRGVLTWAFLFEGRDYFEGFRTLATNGIHKPVLNVFKMLGKLGGRRILLSSSGALGADRIIANKVLGRPDIDGLAAASADAAQILIWNYHDDVAAGQPAAVRLAVQPPRESIRSARIAHYRIDDTHSNAYTRWLQLGSPEAPTTAQYAELKKAGELELLEPVKSVDLQGGQLSLDFALPRLGVSLIEIRWIR